jgi:putative transposase
MSGGHIVEKFDREKHHRRSIRLKGYDYSSKGAYFVTLVSHLRECLFGEVATDGVVLNALGEIVVDEWKKSGGIRKNMEFDEFVIMPNHIHGIVHIVDCRGDQPVAPTTKHPQASARGDEPVLPIQPTKQPFANGRGELTDGRGDRPVAPTSPAKRSLPSFISGFKSAVTKRINELRQMPGIPVWQRSYYEHIIRDDVSLNRIREYIINNPLQWDLDPENPKAGTTHQGNPWE